MRVSGMSRTTWRASVMPDMPGRLTSVNRMSKACSPIMRHAVSPSATPLTVWPSMPTSSHHLLRIEIVLDHQDAQRGARCGRRRLFPVVDQALARLHLLAAVGQHVAELARQFLAPVGLAEQLDAGVEPAAVDDGVLRIA